MVFHKLQLLIVPALILAQVQAQITPDQFAQRRQEIKSQLKPGERMILLTNPVRPNGGVDFIFRPDSDFWYATGLVEPMAALVISSEAITIKTDERTVTGTEFLFLRERNPAREVWDGHRVGVERAPEMLQIEHALNVNSFADALKSAFDHADTVYLNLTRAQAAVPLHSLAEATLAYLPADSAPRSRNPFARLLGAMGRLKKFTGKTAKMGRKLKFKQAGEILHPMRHIKSAEEMALLQRAIDITGTSQVAAMSRAADGIYEYQLQAEIEFVFKDNGARRSGFASIVASGSNALTLHYEENDRQISAGELVLIDIGAEYQMYTADITRTIPASGRFSEPQKEIYNHVLQAQELAMAAIKPGVTLRDLHIVAKTYLDSVGYGKYFIHGLSHWLGMDVHDVGARGATVQPGTVFTIEPGIYIPVDDESVEARYRGIGVRIEDDFMATEDGYEHLSRNIPRTVEEIERVMNEED